MALVVYMSHPIGESDGDRAERRQDNIANAGEWVRFFIDHTRWTLICPWYVSAITHGEPIYGPRRLMDQLAALERCDILALVGGIISPHMNYEAQAAKRYGIPVVDLTSFGVLPPVPPGVVGPYRVEPGEDDTTQLILARVKRAILRQPRRVWLPLMTDEEIEQVKRLRHDAYTVFPGEHKGAVAWLDRAIERATDLGDD